MAADIFISFASKDVKVALTLCSAIESRGFKCWISARDIQPGENFQVSIVRALRNAKILLLVFTANSNASEEMTKELALASQQKMIVIPLRVEDVAPSDAFAYEFATRQWIDVFADWEFSIEQLCRRIEHALSVHSVELGAQPLLDPAEELLAAEPEAPETPEVAAPEPVAPEPPAPEPITPVPTSAADFRDHNPNKHAGRFALAAVIIALVAVLALAIPKLTQKEEAEDHIAAETVAPAAKTAETDAAAAVEKTKLADALAVQETKAAEARKKASAERRAKQDEKKKNAVDIPF